MTTFTIPIQGTHKTLGGDDVFFIAEIGKNFIQSEEDRSTEEYLENAKALVNAAVEANADAVKFQTHEVEDEVLNIEFTSPHFQAKGSDRYAWVTRNMNATPLEEFWKPLKEYCDKQGIIFFSTPMSRKAAYKLQGLDVPLWKVGSGDVQDYVTMDYLIETGKPIIISSGMVSLDELHEIVEHVTERGGKLIVLYCISQYPAPKEYFNLATIEHLTEKHPNVVIGFSDHSIGHDVAFAAIKLGARVIEKHFSFSRDLWGSDHKASITPDEFKEMIEVVRGGAHHNVDHTPYYGHKERELEGANNQFRPYFNKAIVLGQDVKAGTELTKDMIYAMRPIMHAGGLPANKFYDVLGKKVNKNLKKYDPITEMILA
jgi:N,N'-diacetyllegionaminate synthase